MEREEHKKEKIERRQYRNVNKQDNREIGTRVHKERKRMEENEENELLRTWKRQKMRKINQHKDNVGKRVNRRI